MRGAALMAAWMATGFTHGVMNTDNVFERRTSENPLTLALNDREQAIFREAVAGMAVGGTRRMLLPPDSSFAVEGSENTVEFEIELLDIVSGPQAAFVRFGGFRGLFRLAIVLRFVPDLLTGPASQLQGRKRVIQRLFNVGVLEAMSEKKASTL